MEVQRIQSNSWCIVCDEDYAAVEISHNGSLKVFWACGTADREIALCPRCFKKLRDKMNKVEV